MFDYWFVDPHNSRGSSPEDSTLWELAPLLSLAPGLLTPFSHSVIAEIMRRGWFEYYDRLGFDPTPSVRLIRRHQGYTYINSSISAALDASAASIEPSRIRVNGELYPLARWEKPGLLGSVKATRSQKRVEALLSEFAGEAVAEIQKTKAWYEGLLSLKWSQAELLQVMEQIERVGSSSLLCFFAAQHNLGLLYNRLFWATQKQVPYPLNMQMIAAASSGATGLIEQEMIEEIQTIRKNLRSAGRLEDLRARLAGYGRENATEKSVDPALLEVIEPFLQRFGHRGLAEGELRNPRWAENPILLLQVILSLETADAAESLPGQKVTDAERATEDLLAKVDAKERKRAEKWLKQIPELLRLQSLALHAFSYIQAGTRRWALAAAQEAMADNRLKHPDEIYFYALEEAKEMMTGEWNVSATDQIRAIAAQRREEYEEWQQAIPSPVLLDDAEVDVEKSEAANPQVNAPVNIIGGRGSGRFVRIAPNDTAPTLAENGLHKTIIGVEQIESGSTIVLPEAAGIVSVNDLFLSPAVAIAAHYQRPLLINARQRFDSTEDGDSMTIDEESV